MGKLKYSNIQLNRNLIKIVKKRKWIIEGVHADEWILPAVRKADFIILLKVKRFTLYKRVIRRYFKKEKEHYESPKSLIKMLYWAHIYKRVNYLKHIAFIKDFDKKFTLLKDEKEVEQFLKEIMITTS